MAKKSFTAAELCKRAALSNKVTETYENVMTTLVGLADNGATIAKIEIDHNVRNAVVRKLIGDGFSVKYNPNYGKVIISWRDATCTAEDASKEAHDATATEEPKAKNKKLATQTCTVDEILDWLGGNAPDDVIERVKAVFERLVKRGIFPGVREPKAKNKKRAQWTVGIMRSVVFENCTFNIPIPINVHQQPVRQ